MRPTLALILLAATLPLHAQTTAPAPTELEYPLTPIHRVSYLPHSFFIRLLLACLAPSVRWEGTMG
jgi:hypothetical protein